MTRFFLCGRNNVPKLKPIVSSLCLWPYCELKVECIRNLHHIQTTDKIPQFDSKFDTVVLGFYLTGTNLWACNMGNNFDIDERTIQFIQLSVKHARFET